MFSYWLLKKLHPLRQITLEITSWCNLACSFCWISKQIKQNLDLNKIKLCLASLGKATIFKPGIFITGGEPLLYPDFKELVTFLDQNQYPFTFVTNGLLLNGDWISLFNSLKYLKSIGISINSCEKSHQLKWLKNIKSKKIIIKTVITKLNKNDLPEIYKILKQYSISYWHVFDLITYSDDLTELKLSQNEMHNIYNELKKMAENSESKIYFGENGDILNPSITTCLQGITSMTIAFNGDIITCVNAPRSGNNIHGNIYRDEIINVWLKKFKNCRSRQWKGCET
jgi:MoaA/NifB/PqqE/SkfB family radical SAM enzyme